MKVDFHNLKPESPWRLNFSMASLLSEKIQSSYSFDWLLVSLPMKVVLHVKSAFLTILCLTIIQSNN